MLMSIHTTMCLKTERFTIKENKTKDALLKINSEGIFCKYYI